MTPKLILLDCDGVLVDSEPVTNQVLASNLARYGMSLTMEDCINLFVGGTLAGVRDIVADQGITLPDTWVEEIYAEAFAALSQGVPVFPGLFEFLDLCDAQGIPVCVVSNGPMEKMQITLGPSGLWDRLQGRIYSGHAGHKPKPDPEMIFAAMARFEAAADQTWFVDDSGSGLTAGITAGVQTFAFVPEGQHLPDVAFHHRVKGFDELTQRLK